ncbi:MAG: hypothetical protein LUD12_10135 [Lachnospiraceae bacterium]|nr:hypothetical protein [Lachnospiraceae bacterium]
MSSQLITLAHLKSSLKRTKELDGEIALAATEALEEMADLVTELQSTIETLESEKETLESQVNTLETTLNGIKIPVCGGFWDGSTLGGTVGTTVDLTSEESSATVTAAESGTTYSESS